MASVALILAILLINRVKSTSVTTVNPESEVSLLPTVPADVFALQIRQIRTSEATPAASSGNNLNGGSTIPDDQLDVQKENFQAISTIYSLKKVAANEVEPEGNVELLSFDGNVTGNKGDSSSDLIKFQPLVRDDCLETVFRHNQNNIAHSQDMEDVDKVNHGQNKKENGSLWTKRDADNTNIVTEKVWREKYDNFLNSKNYKDGQQKPDSDKINKMTQTTTIPTTIQILPITREVFKGPPKSFDTSKNIIVTESNIEASYTEDWFDAKDRTKIRFSGLPQKQTYLIPTLRIDEGFHPFSFMSKFFYLIYPFDFPIGLIKDIVWGKFTFPYSFLQSVKVESTFLAFIIVFACIALVLPSYLLILAILSLFSRSSRDDEIETGALFLDSEDSGCNDRLLVFITLSVVVLCCVLISGMEVSNEQAHAAATGSQNVIRCACADIAAWLSASVRELHHSILPPVDLVLHAFGEDLRNAESMLGDPIQKAIASESGIELVFDSLADIITESEDLSTKISSLRDVSIRAEALASATSDRIKDLARQLDSMKKHCGVKDAPLCDTVNTHSLEIKIKFDLILHEQQLVQLRSLGVDNLTQAISTARQEFRLLPSAISSQTAQVRDDILQDIEKRRIAVHNSVKVLSDIARHLTADLHTLARQLETSLERVQIYELGRWMVMLIYIVISGLVMTLIVLAIFCGCGDDKNHARRALKVSSVFLCLVSLILWGMISTIFLIAGHFEVYVCHALWDTPQYGTLSALLDRPSPLLPNNKGIFDVIFSDLHINITNDVSIKDVLRDCERDRPAYIVFQLDKVWDVNKETSYFEWEELQADLGRLSSVVDVGLLKTISVSFNKLLNEILVISDVNLAKYRMDFNVPVVGKDLPSLVDQLENIAAQVTDLTTAGRFESLATRAERLYQMSIKPLEQLRADLVFKLTELELQLMPFRRKLNISLSHIHTAQFYIDNQGDVIAQKKISMYMSRLISHAAGWRTHVLVSVGKHAARCQPLFSVYAALRTLLCTNYIASLHGWWVCGFLLAIIWCAALTPLCVKLWRSYGRKMRAQEALTLTNLASGQQDTPTTALCDDNNWNIPGPPAPPVRNDSW